MSLAVLPGGRPDALSAPEERSFMGSVSSNMLGIRCPLDALPDPHFNLVGWAGAPLPLFGAEVSVAERTTHFTRAEYMVAWYKKKTTNAILVWFQPDACHRSRRTAPSTPRGSVCTSASLHSSMRPKTPSSSSSLVRTLDRRSSSSSMTLPSLSSIFTSSVWLVKRDSPRVKLSGICRAR